MLLFRARIVNEQDTDKSYSIDYKPQIEVRVDAEDIPLYDDHLLNHLEKKLDTKNHNLTINYRRSGIHDTKPISIVSMHSINKLAEEMGRSSLDPLRFRSNFYVQWNNNEAFYEDQLVGKSLQIGNEVVLHIVKSNVRCIIINVDPQSAERDSSIFKTVSQRHDAQFGIYGEIRTCGKVNVGDIIYALE
ncbi:MAG: hypothetical protein HeimC2_31090 [Candidatus Heimdallarchaeota archaeon LC_2]|nr:MAG: hypothetical protein HeimC2_31090 [Candidatus Heimdallarchaeota archaeon LC_2]